jgi:hypothetical protein
MIALQTITAIVLLTAEPILPIRNIMRLTRITTIAMTTVIRKLIK